MSPTALMNCASDRRPSTEANSNGAAAMYEMACRIRSVWSIGHRPVTDSQSPLKIAQATTRPLRTTEHFHPLRWRGSVIRLDSQEGGHWRTKMNAWAAKWARNSR